MNVAVLLTTAAVLALAGSAAAAPLPPLPDLPAVPAVPALPESGEVPLLEVIYENVYSLQTCLSASVSGSVGLRTIEEPPYVALDAPTLNPPTPGCLVLP